MFRIDLNDFLFDLQEADNRLETTIGGHDTRIGGHDTKIEKLQVSIRVMQIFITRNPSPSATTCEASGGKLASLAAPPPPLASLAKPRLQVLREPLKKRLDLQVKPRPRMASEVGSEVTRSP